MSPGHQPCLSPRRETQEASEPAKGLCRSTHHASESASDLACSGENPGYRERASRPRCWSSTSTKRAFHLKPFFSSRLAHITSGINRAGQRLPLAIPFRGSGTPSVGCHCYTACSANSLPTTLRGESIRMRLIGLSLSRLVTCAKLMLARPPWASM